MISSAFTYGMHYIRICQFLDWWLNLLFPSDICCKALAAFGLLCKDPIMRWEAGPRWRSGLCADGYPVEFSFLARSDGRFAVRFGCDTTDPSVSAAEQLALFRRIADNTIPCSAELRPELDRIFRSHLCFVPSSSRFLVWHGASFTSEGAIAGKLYFNTSWLRREDILLILAQSLPNDRSSALHSMASIDDGIAFVGYDFDCLGLSKINMYSWIAKHPDDIVRFVSAEVPYSSNWLLNAYKSLIEMSLASSKRATRVSVGIHARNGDVKHRLLISLPDWRFPTDCGIGTVVSDAIAGFGLRLPAFDGSSDAMFDRHVSIQPTVLALGTDHSGESITIYFQLKVTNSKDSEYGAG